MFEWFRKYVRKIGILGIEVEFHPPVADASHSISSAATSDGNTPVAAGGTIEAEPKPKSGDSPRSGDEGMTFDAVIQAIRENNPEAVLGRTAEQGPYFDRAVKLTNFRLYSDDPPSYGAVQPNGKTMWLYLGKGGRICCGDKE